MSRFVAKMACTAYSPAGRSFSFTERERDRVVVERHHGIGRERLCIRSKDRKYRWAVIGEVGPPFRLRDAHQDAARLGLVADQLRVEPDSKVIPWPPAGQESAQEAKAHTNRQEAGASANLTQVSWVGEAGAL